MLGMATRSLARKAAWACVVFHIKAPNRQLDLLNATLNAAQHLASFAKFGIWGTEQPQNKTLNCKSNHKNPLFSIFSVKCGMYCQELQCRSGKDKVWGRKFSTNHNNLGGSYFTHIHGYTW